MKTQTVLAAVGSRISAHGDLPIRISHRTMRVIMKALGLRGWVDTEDYREIDALALDMLRHLALERAT